jgi:hypothetical protein
LLQLKLWEYIPLSSRSCCCIVHGNWRSTCTLRDKG